MSKPQPRTRSHVRGFSTMRAKVLAPVALASVAALALAACGTKTPSSTGTTAGGTGTTVAQTSGGSITLTEAGSSLLYPLFQIWAPAYHTEHPNVTISPAAGGSGLGISDAIAGTVNIGASDAYLSPGNVSKDPDLENIPLAISAQMVNYNLPGVTKHLNLSGQVLSQIYQGKITTWNDPAIAAANPGVTLPPTKIVPLHRSDGSGDSFIFTTYLSDADPSGWGAKYHYNTNFTGPPISGALAENGNGGMVTGCAATPGCVAYIGISYLSKTNSAGLGEAKLKNAAGNYLLPNASTIVAEASGFAPKTPPNETISLIYGPAPQGYPIINYEYAIVSTRQPSPPTASAVKALLSWASNPADGSAPSFLNQVGFQPLPTSVVALSTAQINKIA